MNSVQNLLLVCLVLALSVRATTAFASVCERDIDCGPDEICESKQCVNAHGSTLSQGSEQTADVPMMLVGEDGRPPYKVQDVATGQSCNTPCTMQVPPGARELRITDETGRDSSFMAVVPPRGGVVRVKPTRYSFLFGGGVIVPFTRESTLTYGKAHPSSVKEDDSSPYHLRTVGVPFWVSANFIFGESGGLLPQLGLQYARYQTDVRTGDGVTLGNITYNEIIGCLCLAVGEQDKGFGGTFGTLVGGSISQTSAPQNEPLGISIKGAGAFLIGLNVGLRYIFIRHFYVGMDAQLLITDGIINVQDSNGAEKLNMPYFSAASMWFGAGGRL